MLLKFYLLMALSIEMETSIFFHLVLMIALLNNPLVWWRLHKQKRLASHQIGSYAIYPALNENDILSLGNGIIIFLQLLKKSQLWLYFKEDKSSEIKERELGTGNLVLHGNVSYYHKLIFLRQFFDNFGNLAPVFINLN